MSRIGSSTVVTPNKPLVTERKSVTVKMGRDDAPIPAPQYRVASMATGTSIIGHETKVVRETLATERAKMGPTVVKARDLTGAERHPDLAEQGLYKDTDGFVIRTVEMGDEALRTFRPVPAKGRKITVADTGPVTVATDDEAIRQVALALGITTRLTAAQKRSIRAYIAERAEIARFCSK